MLGGFLRDLVVSKQCSCVDLLALLWARNVPISPRVVPWMFDACFLLSVCAEVIFLRRTLLLRSRRVGSEAGQSRGPILQRKREMIAWMTTTSRMRI